MSTASAEVTVTRCDSGPWLVALHGEHDLSSASFLERRTSSIWPSCGVAIIDLSQADFISSSVIRWLVRVKSELEAQGALSIIEGAPGSFIARTLGLFGARHLFPCYPTLEEALAQVAADARVARVRSPTVPGYVAS